MRKSGPTSGNFSQQKEGIDMLGAAIKIGGVAALVAALIYGVTQVAEVFSQAASFFPGG